MRPDNRKNDELRLITVQRNFTGAAPGCVLISAGDTAVLCSASITEELPPWMKRNATPESTKGWLTAEYRMLPGSTSPRTSRSDKPDGRATEIQRLIGRSLRSVVNLEQLGQRTIYIDCDVLRADGGTRTLSITGAFIALKDAILSIQDKLPKPDESVILDSVAAVSAGIVNGVPILDLSYCEDVNAEVDMNIVMTGAGRFIEIQGTGEEATFSEEELQQLLTLGKKGISELFRIQQTQSNR
ncbi:MAG: ribonuclease PH [Planctomycetaceae bacterium]|nr:ribonuclease PH [Planctomycetaceae bacterium]